MFATSVESSVAVHINRVIHRVLLIVEVVVEVLSMFVECRWYFMSKGSVEW